MDYTKQQTLLFDLLRKWAYGAVRAHRETRDFAAWQQQAEAQAISFNKRYQLLANDECRNIAHTVAVWCWDMDEKAWEDFLKRQRERGRKGGLAKGRNNAHLHEEARILRQQGLSFYAIAKKMGVSHVSVKKWCTDKAEQDV